MRTFIFVLLCLVAGTSYGQSTPEPKMVLERFATPKTITVFNYRQRAIPIDALADFSAKVEMSQDEFAELISIPMIEMTKELGAEVCATFSKNENGLFGARITTAYSRAACPVTNAKPSGYTETKIDIHTHVEVERYLPTEIDKAFLRGTYGKHDYVQTYAYDFSDTDYEKPMSYLAQSHSLLYAASGKKSKKTIKIFIEQ